MSQQLHDAGQAFRVARDNERRAAANLYAAIRLAILEGMNESQAARVAGVDRMTVRRALGKL